jgi:predicted protein tyrosine phosphatase
MSFVVVCPLSKVAASVSASGASHLISLVDDGTPVVRPQSIPAENHLFLAVNDISEPMDGMVVADHTHVQALIDFVRAWDGHDPLVVHCYAGISRSTASAYAAVCALNPQRQETAIAQALRRASPIATPNIRIVTLADQLLGREGRMVAAIEAIGRGDTAMEGQPFRLEVE